MNAVLKFALKGSVLGALAFSVAVSGCSDDGSTDEGGAGGDNGGGTKSTAGSAGKTTAGSDSKGGDDGGGNGGTGGGNDVGGETGGGTAPIAGNGAGGGEDDVGGQSAGGNGAGGAGPVAGPAVAKFCNTLTIGDKTTTFRLDIGTGDSKVSFEADTFECTPLVNEDCTPIALGDQPYELFDLAKPEVVVDNGEITNIEDGDEWIFFTATLDNQPVLDFKVNEAALVCKTSDFDDIFPPM